MEDAPASTYSTVPTDAPRPERRWNWPFLVGLACGLTFGAAVGARYLKWAPSAQLYLGFFLPPHSANFAQPSTRLVRRGMAKQEVIRALGVEQVVVMPGDMAKETWRWVLDDPSENAERARSLGKIAEVWVIPDLQSGASGFTSLCFDDTQRLSEIAASHFMVGFPVNPYHYAK